MVHASEPLRSRACTRPTQRPSSPQFELYQFATKSPLGHAVMVGSWLCPEKGSSRPSPGHLTYRRMTGGMGSSDHLGQRAPLGGGVYPGARIGGVCWLASATLILFPSDCCAPNATRKPITQLRSSGNAPCRFAVRR